MDIDWKMIFEAVMPRYKQKIDVIAGNIERHSQLLRDGVTFEHIAMEQEARVKSLEAFQRASDFQITQSFRGLETAVGPRSYG